MPIFCLWRLMSTLGSVMSTFSKKIFPPVGFSRRFSDLKKVDFPEPEGPITATTSPLCISVEIPSRTILSSNCFCRFSTLINTSVFTSAHPPFHFTHEISKQHYQNQIKNCRRNQRNKSAVSTALYQSSRFRNIHSANITLIAVSFKSTIISLIRAGSTFLNACGMIISFIV